MGLLWPGFLLLLGLIPLIVGIYIWMLRRRRFAVRYSSLVLVHEALPHQSRLRRHLPFAMFLLALASLVIAFGRPVAIVNVPTGQTTIIFAMDVSRSMCATDIQPNRLQAAEAAALSFIQRQKPGTQIGIVAFAGFAVLIQPPTTDQEALLAAVESLTTARRTAIGSAILKSLDAIAEVNKNVAPSVSNTASGVQPTPVPNGAYVPDIIVLLSDGASNTGPLPLDAAQQAVDRGVRVYTIGFGTDNENVSMPFCGQQFQDGELFGGGQQIGGGGQFGGRFRRGIDETTLKQIAAMTGGAYYLATSAGELQHVFQSLPIYLSTRQETTEISVAFTAIGALLAAIAILLALIWHPLP
jgi:Ca-activated chloride channel family protein